MSASRESPLRLVTHETCESKWRWTRETFMIPGSESALRALIHHAAKARWGRRKGWYNGTTDPAIWGRPEMEIEDIHTLNETMIALGGSSFWCEGDTAKGDVTTCDCLIWQPSKWQKLSTQIAWIYRCAWQRVLSILDPPNNPTSIALSEKIKQFRKIKTNYLDTYINKVE